MSAYAITLSNAVLNMVTVELVTITAPAILNLQFLRLLRYPFLFLNPQFLRLLMYPFLNLQFLRLLIYLLLNLFLNPQFLRLLIYPASLTFQTMRMATVPVLMTL